MSNVESSWEPGVPDDENPEMTEEMFARAQLGPPWATGRLGKAVERMRATADALRAQADALDAEADRLDRVDDEPSEAEGETVAAPVPEPAV